MDQLGKPNFRQIAHHLRQDILDGRHPPGTLLPPEPELAQRFGVSRSLVNRALQLLAAEGKVTARQGRGTMVTWLPPLLHSPARYPREIREGQDARGAFDAEIRALGLEPQHEITTEHTQPPEHIAEALGLPRGRVNCLVRRRRLLASRIPVRLNASWIPLEIAGGSTLEDPSAVLVGGIKSALADLGFKQVAASERFMVRPPSDAEAVALEISPERSVLDIFHVGRTSDGRVVEVTTTVTPADNQIVEHEFRLS
ncbi:GntR family transcriptional regulator [Nonomuraea sp. NPDC048916]|uniref:GntR family transcriptional regulator n=1 Tax=Nonomuraea sp. NPDC048916 TaxID=3154232 RepID=UPI0033DC182E